MTDICGALQRNADLLEDCSDISVLRDFTVGSGLYELSGMLQKAAINQRRAAEYITLYKNALAAIEQARSELILELAANRR